MSPHSAACSAVSLSPSSARPIARAVPTSRGRKYVPPESGIEPDLAERLDEARRLRGDDDVAGEREVGARAGRDAVDRADDRQRQRAQREHQRLVVALDRRAEIDRRVAGRHRAIGEILPRAEAAAGAGQQQHARRRVGA